MVFDDDCELSEGVSYEVLQENDFTKQISIYTNGFVRLHPYNQVAEQGKPAGEHHNNISPNFRSSPSVFWDTKRGSRTFIAVTMIFGWLVSLNVVWMETYLFKHQHIKPSTSFRNIMDFGDGLCHCKWAGLHEDTCKARLWEDSIHWVKYKIVIKRNSESKCFVLLQMVCNNWASVMEQL